MLRMIKEFDKLVLNLFIHLHNRIGQMSTTCDNYKFSFFPRTIVNWNRLTNEIIMIEDMERFKALVANQVLTF